MAGWVSEWRKTRRPRADGYDVANYWHDIAAAFFVGLRLLVATKLLVRERR